MRLFGSSREIGSQIKKQIKEQTGLVGSVGIAPNKFLAKLGSDLDKPDGFVVMTEHNKLDILERLDVSRMWGVGPVAQKALSKRGINTIGQLREFGVEELEKIVGSSAEELIRLANGIDERSVTPPGRPKSISHEKTFGRDIAEKEKLLAIIDELTEKVCIRLRAQELEARTITLKLRYGNFRTVTRSRTLNQATDITRRIKQTGFDIFEKWYRTSRGALRLVGFGVSGLEEGEKGQGLLFEDRSEQKQKRLDRVIDRIRDRYGHGSVGPGGY